MKPRSKIPTLTQKLNNAIYNVVQKTDTLFCLQLSRFFVDF